MNILIPAICTALWSQVTLAQVVGTSFGFASGTTGGGSAQPAAPSDIAELTTWLADSTPRVILIDKTFDFRGSLGTTTTQVCEDSVVGACPGGSSAGQYSIQSTCTTGTWVTETYDNAGIQGLPVGSNKSIVGVGSSGVIMGRGLQLSGNVSNIIIQNILITDINPQFIWGGDALSLEGCDKVWIDHCKFSLIGRQMISTGYAAAGHVTISNNEFDGVTSWSASCNGEHYWTMLLYGLKDYYTLTGNYIHDCSGRGPHIGTTYDASVILFHSYNNLYENSAGHAFDVDATSYLLIEANSFSNWSQPMTPGSATNGGHVFDVAASSNTGTCSSYLGRSCIENEFVSSGAWQSLSDTAVLSTLASYKEYLPTPVPVSAVSASVKSSAGTGKLTVAAAATAAANAEATARACSG